MTVLKLHRSKYGHLPADLHAAVTRIIQNSARTAIDAAAAAAITDNSGGATTGPQVLVPTQDTVFVSAGADIALKTSFDTAVGTVNDAIAVLADSLSDIIDVLAIDGAATPYITQGDGTIAVADTIAAVTVTVTGDAGATAVVVSRANGNLAISNMRNNLATINAAFNQLAASVGEAAIVPNGGGSPDPGFVLANNVDGGVAVDNTADVLSKAAADAALNAMQDNIAHIATVRDTLDTAMATALSVNVTL